MRIISHSGLKSLYNVNCWFTGLGQRRRLEATWNVTESFKMETSPTLCSLNLIQQNLLCLSLLSAQSQLTAVSHTPSSWLLVSHLGCSHSFSWRFILFYFIHLCHTSSLIILGGGSVEGKALCNVQDFIISEIFWTLRGEITASAYLQEQAVWLMSLFNGVSPVFPAAWAGLRGSDILWISRDRHEIRRDKWRLLSSLWSLRVDWPREDMNCLDDLLGPLVSVACYNSFSDCMTLCVISAQFILCVCVCVHQTEPDGYWKTF